MRNALVSSVQMKVPNEEILIFDGAIKIEDVSCNGLVKIKWLPSLELRIIIRDCSLNNKEFNSDVLFVKVGENDIRTKIFVTNKSLSLNNKISLSGIVNDQLIFGGLNGKVKYLDFNLVNFRNYTGELKFICQDHTLIIQNILDNKRIKDLRNEGGFIISNNCRINFNIPADKSRILFLNKRLEVFLSFINGRRVPPLFLKAYTEDNTLIYEDFTTYPTDNYKFVQSWMPFKIDKDFCALWQNFLNITEDENDFERIDFIVHWYLEALNNSGYVNGSIILLQSSFEILYSWLVLEKKIINPVGNHKEKDFASNKIRSLLFHYNMTSDFPLDYNETFSMLDKTKFEDFAYAFTSIRNCYVHFSESKRDVINKLKDKTWPILNTGIFYTEVLLLNIFGYKGLLRSRVKSSGFPAERQVSIFNLDEEVKPY